CVNHWVGVKRRYCAATWKPKSLLLITERLSNELPRCYLGQETHSLSTTLIHPGSPALRLALHDCWPQQHDLNVPQTCCPPNIQHQQRRVWGSRTQAPQSQRASSVQLAALGHDKFFADTQAN